MQQSLRLPVAIGTFLVCTAAGSAIVEAQGPTTVTIDRAVRLPGVVLAPGRYEFRTPSPFLSGDIIVVRHIDGDQVFVRVTRIDRPRPGAVFGMRPGVGGAGSLPEIASWYPEGGLIGYAFASKAIHNDALSATGFGVLDQRLTVANKAVSDAKEHLLAAERDRNEIRTERSRAK